MTNKAKSITSIHSLLGYQGFGNRQELEQLMNDSVSPQDFHFSLLRFVELSQQNVSGGKGACCPPSRMTLSSIQRTHMVGDLKKKKTSKLSSDLSMLTSGIQISHPYINNINTG